MPPQSRPWLLPVACAVLGVVWVLWLARGGPPAEEEAFERASTAQSPAPQSPPPQLEAKTAPQDPASSPSESGEAGVAPSGTRVTERPTPPIESSLQLAILAPTSASIGEGFDIRVTIATRKAIGRIVVEIAYDPILLRARSTEDIDYTQRPPGERAFSIGRMSDGQITVVMTAQEGAAGQELPASSALAQFEAIATGSTQIRVSGVSVTDTTGQPLPWAATGQESQIIIN